jgi:hypothetical protein
MKRGALGFLRTDIVRYAPRGNRWRGKVMLAICILIEVLAIAAFVTGVVVVLSLFERV